MHRFNIIIPSTILILVFVPIIQAQTDVSRNYLVIDSNGNFQTLNLTITHSLYSYYVEKSHLLFKIEDIDRFVTPQVVKPIAELLKQVSLDDEDFVNQVLKWNRQHVYNESNIIYPAETLYLGVGDCDVFSVLVSSVLIAGNVTDVVMLTWDVRNTKHMNLGVYLPYIPKYYTEGTGTLSYVMYDNKKYYIAETTDQGKSPSEKSFVLGNFPSDLEGLTPTNVIPVKDYDNSFVEQVMAEFIGMETSVKVSIDITHSFTIPYIYPIIIRGQVVNYTGTTTLYYSHDGKEWFLLSEVPIVNGSFTFTWNIDSKLYITDSRNFSVEFLLPETVHIKSYVSGAAAETSITYIPLWFVISIILAVISLLRRK